MLAEIGAIAKAAGTEIEVIKKGEKIASTVEKTKKTIETVTEQKDGDWGTKLVKETGQKAISDKLKDYFKSLSPEGTASDDLPAREGSTEGEGSIDGRDYDGTREKDHFPRPPIKDKLNEYFKSVDDIGSAKNSNSIEKIAESTGPEREVHFMNKNAEVNEVELRDLTEEEKQKLRKEGMSEENIRNCKVDQNGVVHLKTINSGLEGKTHPETGVKYEKKVIDLNGTKVEGVFPEFDSVFECDLPKELLMASDDDQFKECMKQLKEAVERDPELASGFTEKQLDRIMQKDQPRVPGYIWHHNEETGKMELVKDVEHQKSNHTGGKSVWGGGNDNR